MFDVIWTDHNRENVGQRRARKGIEKEKAEKKKRDDERSQSGRTSVSTRSSASSADKAFGIFGGKGSKKSLTPSTATKLSQLHTPSVETQTRKNSLRTTQPSSTSHSSRLAPVQPTEGNYAPERVVESGGTSPADRSSRDSIFSKWTDRSGGTIGSPSVSGASFADSGYGKSYLQDLGGGSYVTKITEYTYEKQTSKTNANHFLSGITITADPNHELPVTPILQNSQSPPLTPQLDRSAPPVSPGGKVDPSTLPSPKGRAERAVMPLPPLPPWVSKFARTQRRPDQWKAPEAWETYTAGASDSSTSTIGEENVMMIPNENDEENAMALDLTTMQREIKKMATASPAIIYLRLTETGSNIHDPEMLEEMAREKQRWMLAAIHQLDVITPDDEAKAILARRIQPTVTKVLALFETQATASYLASLRNYAPVYHLSPEPLSHTIYPNVHPMLFPTVSPSALSVAPQSFAEVYSLSLPSLVVSSDIPHMLRAIHRCLAPGGSLRLILINPAPEVNTLGPKLRTWLEKHLLLNLELKFRCMNPTKLFPNWLEETHLRAEGSTIVRPKFHAIAGDLPKVEDLETHFDITPRLYSQVGRMLWKEVWGRHVATDNWWWEDKSIVQECKELGTFWQYHLITAVRQESE